MRKTLAGILAATMVLTMVGCGSSGDSSNTEENNTQTETNTQEEAASYKLGMGVSISTASSQEGNAQVDATVAAVVLDQDGKIVSCKVDVAQNKMDVTDGQVPEDAADATYLTKKELKDDYGMKGASGIGKEWYEQAEAFEQFVVGKTADEVAAIPVEEAEGHTVTTDADLAAGCTMSVSALMEATTKACNDAYARTYEGEGTLNLAITSSTNYATVSAADGEDGIAAMYSCFSAVVVDSEGKILCDVYDEAQPKVTFNELGEITSDPEATILTKRELHDDYGMIDASSIGKEWYEQAAAMEEYVIGKTADEVTAIETVENEGHNVAVDETLAASCTISIGDIIVCIAKAATLQ